MNFARGAIARAARSKTRLEPGSPFPRGRSFPDMATGLSRLDRAHTRDTTRGWCGAAVAKASDVRSVGLDAELDEALEANLFRRVLTEPEVAFVTAEPEATRGFLAKLVFSAKECVYKCLLPLSSELLDFKDVELTRPIVGRF